MDVTGRNCPVEPAYLGGIPEKTRVPLGKLKTRITHIKMQILRGKIPLKAQIQVNRVLFLTK